MSDKSVRILYAIGGAILAVLNFAWLFENVDRLYHQIYGGILYFVFIPEWVLILNIICAFINIVISILLIMRKIYIKKVLLINSISFIVCMVLKHSPF